MQLTVYDNGIGAAQRKPSKGMGLGLQNTLLRLQQAYGTVGRLEFDQPAGGGTWVRLHFDGRRPTTDG